MGKMPITRLDQGCNLLAAETLLKHLRAFTRQIEAVRRAREIESLHRMRVATRRLRAASTLFAPFLPAAKLRVWQKRTRKLTRILGAARDADVQVNYLRSFLNQLKQPRLRPGISRLLLRLRQRRRALQPKVEKALARWQQSGASLDMERALGLLRARARLRRARLDSPAVFALAHQAISRRLEELLAYEPYVTDPERVAELHQMRIAAKRLRYTIEPFAPIFAETPRRSDPPAQRPGELDEPLRAAEHVQTLLGAVHDGDVWWDFLPRFMDRERQRTLDYLGRERAFQKIAPGLEHLRRSRRKARQAQYRHFLRYWRRLREGNVWEKLLADLRARQRRGGQARIRPASAKATAGKPARQPAPKAAAP